MKMIAIGDNVTDCYINDQVYYPGGNAVNVAVGCKRTGCFEEVAYLGILGDDENADHIRWALSQEEVLLTRCRKVYAPTAQPKVILKDGDRTFLAGRKDSAAHLFRLRLAQEDIDYVSKYDVCHTSCFSNIETELPILQKYLKISFDFSEFCEESYLETVCPYLTYAFFSGADLSEDKILHLINYCHNLGTEIVGVTLGSRGSIFSKNGEIFRQKIKPVNAIDTMGAGDSFIAGFITKYTEINDMDQSLNFAASCAAQTCLVRGAFGYPHAFSPETLEEM